MLLFAKNIRKRAEELGLSNAEVARRAGLSERRYAHYVTGSREPDLKTLVKIAGVLQTTPNDLLTGGPAHSTRRSLQIDRIQSSLEGLGERELELFAAQAAALAALVTKETASRSRKK